MAYIYSKPNTYGNIDDNTLVLGVREALIYPFSLGDWSEIRVSYWLSMTNSADLNGLYVAESTLGARTNYKQGGWWGLKDSGTDFPSQGQSVFMGIGNGNGPSYADGSTLADGSLLVQNAGGGNATLFSSGTLSTPDGYNSPTIYLPSTSESISTGNYASFYSQRYRLTKNGPGSRTGVYMYWASDESTYNTPPQDYSIANLRVKALNTAWRGQDTSPASSLWTGYWTSDFTVNGSTNIAFPNSIFIYLPYFNNRLRIHALLVEKIS